MAVNEAWSKACPRRPPRPVARTIRTAPLTAAFAALLVMSLCLLGALARNSGARRDEALTAAITVAGRGLGVVLLAHLSMRPADWAIAFYDCVVGVLATCVLAQAAAMAEHGPAARAAIPQWMARSGGDHHAAALNR